jgi:hypothetical protein
MTKTISFVASDELAEFLEAESEKRMTTISSTAQMLLAEKAREMGGVSDGAETAKPASGGEGDDVFGRNPDEWYKPSGKYEYAVHIPEDSTTADAGDTRYYKTRDGAAKALRRWYE